MSWIGELVLRAFGRRRQTPAPQRTAKKEIVICLGCHDDCAILDKVLAPGSYEVSFISSMERAYSQIAAAMPDRVILSMRADDEQSLGVLSMLTLDPRTNRIPVMTCVVTAVGRRDEDVDDDTVRSLALERHNVVMH
jgi:PleD family two-component response regulator